MVKGNTDHRDDNQRGEVCATSIANILHVLTWNVFASTTISDLLWTGQARLCTRWEPCLKLRQWLAMARSLSLLSPWPKARKWVTMSRHYECTCSPVLG